MATIFATKTKAAIGTLLATSILASAMPAQAQYRGDYRRDRDGISAGEVIAGAIVVGGLAAILSSGNDRYRDGYRSGGYYDRNDRDYDWHRYGGSRQAIEQCVYAVERRGGWRDSVDVRRITDVDRIRGGYRIEGRVAVDYRGGRYDRYDRYDRDRGRYDDRGSFTCDVRFGRIDDLRVRGI